MRENSAYQAFQESLAETLDAIQQIRASNRERFYIGRTIGSAGVIAKIPAAFTWKVTRQTACPSLFPVGFRSSSAP